MNSNNHNKFLIDRWKQQQPQLVQRKSSSTKKISTSSSSSSSSSATTTIAKEKSKFRKENWNYLLKRIAGLIKLVRIPTLIFAVYNLGYQNGTVETFRSPKETKKAILSNIVSQYSIDDTEKEQQQQQQQGVTSPKKGSNDNSIINQGGAYIFNTMTIQNNKSALCHTICRVGDDIVYAATEYVEEQLLEGIIACNHQKNAKTSTKEAEEEEIMYDYDKARLYRNTLRNALQNLQGETVAEQTIEEMIHYASSNSSCSGSNSSYDDINNDTQNILITEWKERKYKERNARRRNKNKRRRSVNNNNNSTEPWSYVLVNSPYCPNAFVSELLPRLIFITTGLFALVETEDELAFILGHEISHLVLGHCTESNELSKNLKAIEVMLLSVDFTPDGFLSLALMSIINLISKMIVAQQSRDNESEADALGIQIAARASYNTKDGSEIMKKLSSFNDENENASSFDIKSILDDHPPSIERYNTMLKASEIENASKYYEQDSKNSSNVLFSSLSFLKRMLFGASTTTTNTTTTSAISRGLAVPSSLSSPSIKKIVFD